MSCRPSSAAALLAVLVVVPSACGPDRSAPAADSAAAPILDSAAAPAATAEAPGADAFLIDPGDGGRYAPRLDPADFVDVIDNPYMPMPVGARWRYVGDSDGEVETIDIVVTDQRRDVMGISAIVVRDTVTVGGELVEDTYDWFAQDRHGNVWYLGESSKDYDAGAVVSTDGSWEAGVGGAFPGIVMPASPHAGEPYRQEFLSGEAEDMMRIVATDAVVTVRAGEFADVVITDDWTPLDPDVVERKAYAPGVGKIREEHTTGAAGFAELVEYSLDG
jgi:hypothetical protein